jgi:hypothetical protein
MTIKPLGSSIVLCENPGCARPALYLFIETIPQLLYAAYCEKHGVPLAKRFQLALPATPPLDTSAN